MRASSTFFITRKEYPKDENTISAKLLVKSGMIFKNDNGIYTYLPFGLKVLNNIKKIIKEEMNNLDADEVLMPSLISSDVFEFTKRKELFGEEMFNVISRNNKEYSFCPTHEELFALLARNKIKSYKDLHFILYQISNKYRDEEKDEYGLIRKKEFCMADAYSFDANDGGSDISYDKMYQSFHHIFNKLRLNIMVVGSDASYMKGLSSEEFQIESEYGDNEVVKCTSCTYASNIEDAWCKSNYKFEDVKLLKKELVKTSNIKTINEVSKYLNTDVSNIIKSLIIKIDEEYLMILLRGNSELNIEKLKRTLNTKTIEIPSSYELERIGTSVGFIGPIDTTMKVIADSEVKTMLNAVCGSNKKDYHFINVVPGRDFKVNKYCDLKLFDENNLCPKCRSKCEIIKGIEVGHIFKLGSNYSKDYNLKYTDETNNINYVHMGSYGIGLDRCMGAIVEKHYDNKGIVWPINVSPFKVCIVLANINDRDSYKYAKDLYEKLNKLEIDTFLDDRKETIGVKFADMDLIGIPIRITVGRGYENKEVELKLRNEKKSINVKITDIIEKIEKIIEELSE